MGLLNDVLSSDDGRLGLALLQAAGPTMAPTSVGQRLAGAFQGFQAGKSADEERKLKAQYLQSQIGENQSQAAYRQSQTAQAQRQLDMQQQFLGGGGLLSPGMSPGQGADAGKQYPTPTPMGPTTDGGPVQAQPLPLNKAQQLSQQYGVPVEAIQADVVFNGGKKISEMIAERAKPNWQNVNGNMVNTNAPGFAGGFQPGMSASANGQVTAWQPDGKGGLVVGAPAGAVDTFRAFNQASAETKPIKVYNPTTGREEYTSEAAVTRAPGPSSAGLPAAQDGVTSNFTGPTEDVLKSIAAIKDPQERSNALAAYANQISGGAKGAGGGRGSINPTGRMAAGPSTSEANTAAADKEYQTGVAKDQVDQRKSIVAAGFSAPSRIAKLQQIDKLLGDFEGGKLSQAGVDFASSMNSLGIKVDKNLPNKEAAQAMSREIALGLRNPAGGAGMPGAMSDADRNFLSSMTPDMAQTAEGRKKIISSQIAIEQRNQQVAEFARKYESKYGKLDNGFYQQLSSWSAANQLFKDAK